MMEKCLNFTVITPNYRKQCQDQQNFSFQHCYQLQFPGQELPAHSLSIKFLASVRQTLGANIWPIPALWTTNTRDCLGSISPPMKMHKANIKVHIRYRWLQPPRNWKKEKPTFGTHAKSALKNLI